MYYLETIGAIGLKVGLSIQINEVNEVHWVSKVKVIIWKVTQKSKSKLVFLGNWWVLWNQISYKSIWMNGNENYTNELGHMTIMAVMPIYGKNFKNLLQNQWPWNWYVAYGSRVVPRLFKWRSWVDLDLDLFYWKVKYSKILIHRISWKALKILAWIW